MPSKEPDLISKAPRSSLVSPLMLYYLGRVCNLMFYGFIFLACIRFIHQAPPFPNNAIPLWKSLLQATSVDDYFLRKSSPDFSIFNPYLPSRGAACFLMDPLSKPYDPRQALFESAQGYFAPLAVTKKLTEKLCIVYCSNAAVAEELLKAAGYRMTVGLGEGRGIAQKIS